MTRREPLTEPCKSQSAVGESVFLLSGHLRESSAVSLGGYEDGVETEAVFTMRFPAHATLHYACEGSWARLGSAICDGGLEESSSVPESGHEFQNATSP